MMQYKKIKGNKYRQINSSITISEAVNQQRSINESLGSSLQQQLPLRVFKSHSTLQPLLLNDQKRADLTEKSFGLAQDPNNAYFRSLQQDGHLNQVLQLLHSTKNQTLTRNKSQLAPLVSEKMKQGSERVNDRSETDLSYISKVGIFKNKNNKSTHVLKGLNNKQSEKNSFAKNSYILNYEDSIINFHEESMIGSQLDATLISTKKFKEIQHRMRKELPTLHDKSKHLFQLLGIIDADIKEKSEFDDQSHQLFQKFSTLCNQLQVVFLLFLGHLIEADQKVIKAKEGTQQLHAQIEKDRQLLQEASDMIKMKDDQLRGYQDGNLKRSQTNLTNKFNTERLRNAQLEKQLELCQSKLKEVLVEGPNGPRAEQVKLENEELLKKIESQQFQIFEASQENDKLHQQIQIFKHNATKHEKLQVIIDIKLQEMEEKISNHDEILRIEREKARRSEERAWMSREEILTIKNDTQDFVKSVQKNIEKIKQLQQRFDEMTVKRSRELDAPMHSQIPQDKDTLNGIGYLLEQDELFSRTMMSQFQSNMEVYDSRLINAYHSQLTSTQRKGGDENFKLSSMRLNYPGFPTLLNKRNLDQEWTHLQTRNLQNIFIGQLRAIMDGMFVEMQKLTLGHNTVLSFQSFVYQWLSNFTINETKQCVEVFADDFPKHKIEDHIIVFYLDLHVPRLDKVWEVQQFRYFLNDSYSMEELYFYLHARNMIRRGSWLPTFNAMSSIAHYMLSEQAFTIVRRFLKDFDENNVKIVITALTDRTVQKGIQLHYQQYPYSLLILQTIYMYLKSGKRTLIQTGFVLQMLLEVFHIEMTNRYRALLLTFPKTPVTFKSFHRFLKGNYINITQSHIVELWRETYLISNGHPNLSAFFTIAQIFFIKELKLPSLWSNYEVNSTNHITYDEKNVVVLKLMEHLGSIEEGDLKGFEEDITQFGNEEHFQILKLFNRPKGDSQPAVNIVAKLLELCLTWNTYNQNSQLINQKGYADRTPDLKAHINLIDFIFKEAKQLRLEQEQIIKFRSKKISSFQRMAKKKTVKFYTVIASMLNGVAKDQEAQKVRDKYLLSLAK